MRSLKPRSLRARLALFYAVVLVVSLAAFAADVWWVEGRLGIRRVDRELAALSSSVAAMMRDELSERATLEEAATELSHVVATPDRAIAILDGGGRPVAASWGGLEWKAAERPPSEIQVSTVRTRDGAWRVRVEPQVYGAVPVSIVMASSLRDVERQQHEVVETMWFALPMALLLSGGGAFWLASIALRPIGDMARQATRITTAGTEMLGDATRDDEVGSFASAFNDLLGRLRSALRTQRQFMADASHELRTPVSIVRTAADVVLSRPIREEAEYREALAIVGSQARRLSHLVDNMLVLARADAGGYPVRMVDLYLDEIVGECCRAVSMLCDERRVTIRAGTWPETPFRGDEDLLRQLVLNVLQNAVQHSVCGGAVTVDLATDSHTVQIAISDSGPGIPPADRARIFERFVRLDNARTGNGSGLGLPIARWIAEAHGGSLVLADSGPEGSVFRITFAHQEGART
jgi:signal transduction histidine kinase